jgi:hypothetical protein
MAYTKADKEKGIGQFNLSDLNLNYVNLVQELNQMLETPNPKTRISKWWRSKHWRYDQGRIDHITTYIEKINIANTAILNLQAKLAVNQEVLEMLIAGAFQQAERAAELQLAQHQNALQAISDEQEGRKHQLKALEIANLNSMADVNLKSAKTQEALAKADFMKMVLTQIDISAMPPTLQTYITSSIFNPNGTQFNDFEMQEAIKGYVVEETKQKARLSEQIVEEKKNEVDFKKWKAEKTKKDIG